MDASQLYGVLLVSSSLVGWYLVVGCRSAIKRLKLGHDWRIPTLPVLSPGIVFVLVYLLHLASLISKPHADSIALGFVLGVLSKILSSTAASTSIKLTAKTEGVGPIEAWLDVDNARVANARQKIADLVQTDPSRIEIHTGDGRILHNDDDPLLSQLANSKVDILGNTVVQCYVRVLPEGTRSSAANGYNRSDSLTTSSAEGDSNSAASVVLYAYPITLVAVAGNQEYFVHALNGYGAATPMEQSNDEACICIRLRKWNPATLTLEDATNVVEHGDRLVLECDGKFMTIYRGWWLAWNSKEPRRSGAFRVEVLDKRGTDRADKTVQLHTTWRFRLRSVKFPEFELGISNDLIVAGRPGRYIGLRKIAAEDDSEGQWLQQVSFYAQLG